MKKTKKFRLFTILIALCMLVGTIPAYALNPYGSLTLTFTSEESIDLGGIEISVYQATPATVTEAYTLYNETFHSTVTTDENGTVTFAKPSQYCSITVELDSLPDGVGITKQTKFFNPDVTEQTVTLATVDRAETELSGTEIKPTFYSADNVQLLADYEVVMSDNTYATMPWESIDAMDSFTLSGAFVDGDMSIPYSIPLDVSQSNIWDKYEILNEYGLITEKAKIVKQSEALIDPQNQRLFTFQIIAKLESYRTVFTEEQREDISINTSLARSVSQHTKELSLVNEALKLGNESLRTTSELTLLDYNDVSIIVADSLSGTDIENFASAIADEIEQIYDYFVTSCGFSPPLDEDGNETEVIIKICSAAEMDYPSNYGETVNNFIRLNYTLIHEGVTNRWKTTLAHEYQHVLQHNYGNYGDLWIRESCANFASAMYAQFELGEYALRDSEYYNSINVFLDAPSLSPNKTTDSRYYSFLFPLYLYLNTEDSMWTTIKRIYEVSLADSEVACPETFAAIDQALKNVNLNYSFDTFYENFMIDNIFLQSTYPLFYTDNWNNMAISSCDASASAIHSNITLEPFGTAYYKFADIADDSGIIVTFDLTSGTYSDFSVLGLIHNDNEPMESIHISVPNPERFTLSISNETLEYYLGNTEYTDYSIVTINKNHTTSLRYNISIN